MNTIFLNNKYTKIYFAIIEKVKQTPYNGFTENHHIVPEHFYTERTRKGPAGWLPGDPDDKDNLLDMPAREHAICHLLLRKMISEDKNAGCVYAAWRMVNIEDDNGNRYRVNSRIYAKLKEEVASTHSATMKGRQAPNKNVPMSEEQKQTIRDTKAKNKTYKTCEHCGKTMVAAAIKQYHGEKCEKNPNRDPNIVSVKTRGKKRTKKQKEFMAQQMRDHYVENPKRAKTKEEKEHLSKKLTGVKKPIKHGKNLSATLQRQRAEGTHSTQIKVSCIKTKRVYTLTTFTRYVLNAK
jgi:hypothetical protein